MKIAIVNLCGHAGKSTLARHLFCPQLNATRIQIETVNSSDGTPDMEVAAKDFKELAAKLNIPGGNFVIDIGASNIVSILDQLKGLRSTRNQIDWWIIPTMGTSKMKADSLMTVKALKDIGIDIKKIVMVPNNLQDSDEIKTQFESITSMRKGGIYVANEGVLASEIFDILKNGDQDVFDLVTNPPDFAALWKAARTDQKELERVGRRQVVQDLAEVAEENLRAVFESTPLAAAQRLQDQTT